MSRLDREKRLDLLRNIIQERRTLTKSELMDAVTVSRMTLFAILKFWKKRDLLKIYMAV